MANRPTQRDYSGRSYEMAPRIDREFLDMRAAYEAGTYEPCFPELFENDTLLGKQTAMRNVERARGTRIIQAFRSLGVRYDEDTQKVSDMIHALMNHVDGIRPLDHTGLVPVYLAETYDLYSVITQIVYGAEGWKLYPTTLGKVEATDPDPTPTPPTNGGEPIYTPPILDSEPHPSAYGLRSAA
jgi:hypothetical protein